jgi:DNA-binding NarL/FixJ family response regulator
VSANTRQLRVLIADPARAARSALRAVLERRGILVCADVEDVKSAVEAAARERPDVCLVDSAVAGRRCRGLQPILSAAPQTRVVLLSNSSSDEDLLDAVIAGASGHLAKTISSRALDAALRDVVSGRSAFPRRLDGLLAAALHTRAGPWPAHT